MEIVWYGLSCFRLRGREATIVTDPCPPTSGYSSGKLTADILTISHDHENHSYLKAVSGFQGAPISAPGEYEVKGVFISGTPTFHDDQRGSERGRNVAFVFEQEGMTVGHLGDLGHTPTSAQVEDLSGIDVLLVPVGGKTTIDGAKAAEVVSLLEPRVVVPMHYQTPEAKVSLEPLDRFLKEMGVNSYEPQSKLSVSSTTLPHETQVIVLECRR